MRSLLPILACLCVLPLQGQKFSAAARQADLDFVATQVPKLHVNFFFQLDPAVYQQAASDLRAQIPSLTDAEFYVRLAALHSLDGVVDPRLRPILSQLAGHDSDRGVQSLARRLLERLAGAR